MGRRGFGYIRRLPSKRYQASYTGADLQRHVAPLTFTLKSDAEAWLADERRLLESGDWQPPAHWRALALRDATPKRWRSTGGVGWPSAASRGTAAAKHCARLRTCAAALHHAAPG